MLEVYGARQDYLLIPVPFTIQASTYDVRVVPTLLHGE